MSVSVKAGYGLSPQAGISSPMSRCEDERPSGRDDVMRVYMETGCVPLSLGKFILLFVRTQEDDAIHVCTRR